MKSEPARKLAFATLDHLTWSAFDELKARMEAGDERAGHALSALGNIGRRIVEHRCGCSECGRPIDDLDDLACVSVLAIADAPGLGFEDSGKPPLVAMAFCQHCVPMGEAAASRIVRELARKAIARALPAFHLPDEVVGHA